MRWSIHQVVWLSLATINPASDWANVSGDVIGDTLLKVDHAYNAADFGRVLTKIHLAENYPGVGRHYRLSCYRKSESSIYTLEIPQEFKDQGFVSRTLAIKHNQPGVLSPASWQVTLSIWQPDPATDPATVIDAGEYTGV